MMTVTNSSSLRASFLILLVACSWNAAAAPNHRRRASPGLQFDHGVDLPTTRPLIIAHRGASGSLPEHTVAAYQRAIDEGADASECDVTVSRDLVLLCMHENWMSDTTNVADVFPPERMNTYFVAGGPGNLTDYFAIDFSLDELKTIRKRQRMDFRDPNYNDLLEIATFEEYVQTAQQAGRPVGLYIETKDPVFINSHPIVVAAGTSLEQLLLDALQRHGYTGSRDPCFLQSFNEDSLLYLSNHTDLPINMLLDVNDDVSDSRLNELAKFAYGIGPAKEMIVRTNFKNQIVERTDLVQRAHAAGLRVHPWTFRNEHEYLAWDYEQDPRNEYEDFFNLLVDGSITDFPGTYAAFLDTKYLCNVTTVH